MWLGYKVISWVPGSSCALPTEHWDGLHWIRSFMLCLTLFVPCVLICKGSPNEDFIFLVHWSTRKSPMRNFDVETLRSLPCQVPPSEDYWSVMLWFSRDLSMRTFDVKILGCVLHRVSRIPEGRINLWEVGISFFPHTTPNCSIKKADDPYHTVIAFRVNNKRTQRTHGFTWKKS